MTTQTSDPQIIPMPIPRLRLASLLLLASAWYSTAATVTWLGSGSDPNWRTAGNWTPAVPSAGDSLIFSGFNQPSPQNDFPAGTTFGGITFDSSASSFTLSGNDIALAGNLLNSSSQPQTISLGIILTNAVTFDVGSADLTVSGTVSGTNSLTKLGAGTLTLNAKTYSGGTTISNGLLVVNNDNGNYTLSGGSLKLNYGSYWSGPTITFTTDASVGTDNGRLDFAGSIGSPGFTWTKIGSGTMNLVHWMSDPTTVLKASAIRVAEGTLGSLINGGNLVQWGGTNVPITVAYGATLSVNDGIIVPNQSITLEGGQGPEPGQGALVSGHVNTGGASFTNTILSSINLNADSTIGTFGGVLVLAGNITGPGGLTKNGEVNPNSQNKLILGGTNTYTGNTTLSSGLVQLASPLALPGGPTAGDVMLASDGTLDLNGFNASINGLTDDFMGVAAIDNSSTNPATLTLGGRDHYVSVISAIKNSGGGPLSIVKVGAGSASLLGPNTYSGSNVVAGGKLEIKMPTGTTTAYGPVVVADGAELSLHFRLAGSSLKATGVTLGTASTLDIDLAGFGNPPFPVINATNGTGILSANGTITINIAGDASVMSAGQFPLIRYTSRTGSGSFVLGSLPANVTAQIVTNTSSIDLKVLSAPVTKWVGNLNNLWDIGTTKNWSVLGTPVAYTDGVGILFDDTAVTTDVNLTTSLSPSATLVSASKDYTFGGVGQLFGGDLTKNGTGKLTLLTANYYLNTTIAAGSLQVDTNGTTATLGLGNVDVEGTLIFDRADPIVVGNAISGAGTVVQQSASTLVLGGGNTYSGGTLVNAGVVQLGSSSALGIPFGSTPLATVSSGSALDLGGQVVTSANPLLISGSGAGSTQSALFNSGTGPEFWAMNNGLFKLLRLAGDTTIGSNGGGFGIGYNGGGIDGRGFNLVKIGANRLMLLSSAVSAPAQFIVGGGGVNIQAANPFGTGAVIVLTNNAWLDSWNNNNGGATYTIANNVVVQNGGGAIRNSNGAWWGRADYDIYSGSITLNDTLTVQNSSSYNGTPGQLTVTGPISGPGNLVKSGSYLVTLSGANTYTGTTLVTNGTLAISTVSQGGGAYVVADGGLLDVPSQTGYLTVPMTSLTLGSSTGAVLVLTRLNSLSASNAPITTTSLTVVGQNSLVVPSAAYTTPGQYPLIKYSGTVAGGGSFVAGGMGRGVPAYISNNVANSSIDLVVTGGNQVTWVGNLNTTWDIDSTANFTYLGSGTTYRQPGLIGDAVAFDDTGVQTTVNIAAPVSPALIVVTNATKNYTFTGAAITGPAGLLKEGPGLLALTNGANTFVGGTVINGGTIQLNNDGSLNNNGGLVTIVPGGTLDLNGYNPSGITVNASGAGVGGKGAIVANYAGGAQQRGPGTINMTGSLALGGTNRWDLRNGAKTLNCPTNAYSLTKVGSSPVCLVSAVVSPNVGDIFVLSGRLGFEGTSGFGDPAKTIFVGNGGEFGLYQSTVPVTKSLVCSNGANITAYGGNTASQNIIQAPVQLVGGTVNFNGNYNNGMLFSNVISGDGGIWVQWNSDVLFSATNSFKGDLETQGRLKLVGNASVNPLNNVTVNNGGSGVLTVQDNTVVGGQTLRLWSGPASGALIVKSNGTINSKTIWVGNACADWSGRTDGTLTLQSGQTLRVDNGARVKGNVVAVSGSTLSPGGLNNLQNTAWFTNALTLQPGSVTIMEVSRDGGVLTNDAVNVVGALSYGGTLQLNNISTNALLAAGDTFKLFSAGSYTGGFTNVAGNTPGQLVTWDVSQLAVNGTVRVATVASLVSPSVTCSFSGGQLTLGWPTENIGWRLLVQTNNLAHGISTNLLDWDVVPGSTQTNSVTIPVDATKPTEFYRLANP